MAYHARPCQFVTLSPASLMHYTRLSASARVVVPSPHSASLLSTSAFLSLLLPSPSPFLRVSVLFFQSAFLFVYFPWSISFPPRDVHFSSPPPPPLSMSLSLSHSFRENSAARKTPRHHAIPFIVLGFPSPPPPLPLTKEIHAVAAGSGVTTMRRKRWRTGADGNDSVTTAMTMTMMARRRRDSVYPRLAIQIIIN